MELTEIFGYVGALFIGIVLGLVGGGGSILTVPILAYLFYINPVTATAYSLFVVGSTALIGTVRNIQKGLVDFKTGFVFATPAFIAVYVTRKYLLPAIPEYLFTVGDFKISKDIAIMVFFAIIMLLASISMIRDKSSERDELTQKGKFNYPLIIIEGAVVGVLTGIVGAGGGFLIIPALVLVAKLTMKKAVATSLLIIAMKSLIGFIGDIQNINIDWTFLLTFTAISIFGIFIGIKLSNYIEGKKLKKGFGYFVLIMAVYILYKEINL